MAKKQLYLLLGVYPDPELAHEDYQDLRILHNSGHVSGYDAAVVVKDATGNVDKHQRETSRQHGAWAGVGVGAAVGLLFAPTIVGAAVAGGVAGGLVEHFEKGLKKHDVKELTEALGNGESALIVIGDEAMAAQTERVLSRSRKRVVKPLDVDHKAFTEALAEAEKEHGDTLGETLKT
jgi:uncharacterized membrane protein